MSMASARGVTSKKSCEASVVNYRRIRLKILGIMNERQYNITRFCIEHDLPRSFLYDGNRPMNMRTLERFSEALQVPISKLMEGCEATGEKNANS